MMELGWPVTPCSLLMAEERRGQSETGRETSVVKVDQDTRLRLLGVMQSCVLRAAAEPLRRGGD